MENDINLKPVPEVGKTYKFYDDGKITPGRQYDATVLRLVSIKEAKKMMFRVESKESSLYNLWKEEVNSHIMDEDDVMYHVDSAGNFIPIKAGQPWLYATDTDWFVECSIPDYDDNTIWFARTIYGEWFSMDIHSSWESGKLDVDNAYTENLNEFIESYGEQL